MTRRRLERAQALDEAQVHAGAAGGQRLAADVLEQGAPQRRLPAHRLVQRPRAVARGAQLVAALGPVGQPVGAVHLVLVEQVGQALGQLVALAQVGVVGEEAAQRGERLALQKARQQAHQPPGQRRLVERRLQGNVGAAQERAIAAPEKARRQLDLDRRGDAAAVLPGQRQLQPLGDAVALHQHHLVLQRRQRMQPHPLHHQLAQLLQAVAVHHHQTRRQPLVTLHALLPCAKKGDIVPLEGDSGCRARPPPARGKRAVASARTGRQACDCLSRAPQGARFFWRVTRNRKARPTAAEKSEARKMPSLA